MGQGHAGKLPDAFRSRSVLEGLSFARTQLAKTVARNAAVATSETSRRFFLPMSTTAIAVRCHT